MKHKFNTSPSPRTPPSKTQLKSGHNCLNSVAANALGCPLKLAEVKANGPPSCSATWQGKSSPGTRTPTRGGSPGKLSWFSQDGRKSSVRGPGKRASINSGDTGTCAQWDTSDTRPTQIARALRSALPLMSYSCRTA